MLVFRDGRQTAPSADLAARCRASVQALQRHASAETTLAALLRCGELECGLADAAAPAAEAAAALTDLCAAALFAPPDLTAFAAADARLARAPLPPTVTISTPEGFAYYALHPLAYAELAQSLARGAPVGVIGIRSIGTTLSALVQAALRARGISAERITVRPTGHPFDRSTELTEPQREWLRALIARGAEFFVVDEGPGLSGSSLLSVGEALTTAGISPDRIKILCSQPPNPQTLRAPNVEARCACFQFHVVDRTPRRPAGGDDDLSGGRWREILLRDREWPESWLWFERPKFLSADRATLFKFEGFGHYGEGAYQRAEVLSENGFAPRVRAREQGFVAYEFIGGAPQQARDVSRETLARMAEYLAVRTRLFPAEHATELSELVHWNFLEAFGHELPRQSFESVRCVIPDGRMQPHEWIRVRDGKLIKVDAASHGDDHFYPGATDIAWDLAGAIIEWDLDASAREHFLELYRHASGDNAAPRLTPYLLAYSVFRLGYCHYAAEAMSGTDEAPRLRAAEQRYRKVVESLAPAAAQAA